MSHLKLKFVNSLLLVSTLFLVTSYLSYSFCIAYDVPKIDHWRWIRGLLIPYVEGNISFWEYLTGEFEAFKHSQIITLLSVWINYKWFNLRYDLDYFVGIIATSMLLFLLLKTFLKQKTNKNNKTFQYFSILALISAFFNINNVTQVSLIQFEYLYLVGAFIFLLIVDKNIRYSSQNLTVFISTVVMFWLGDAMGTSAILATIIFYVFFLLRKNFRHQILVILFALLISFCVAKLLVPIQPPHGSPLRESLVFIFSNPLETFHLIINCYAQGIIDNYYIEKLGKYKMITQFLIGFLALLFQLYAVFLIVKNNQKNDSWLPLLLIFFCGITVIGIALLRLPDFGSSVAFSQRYTRLHQVGALGALWVYLSLLLRSENKMSRCNLSIVLVVSLVLITHTTANHYRKWKMLPQSLKLDYEFAKAIRESSSDDQIDLGRYHIRCKDKFCGPSIDFLKNNDLCVFRSYHPVINSADI